MMGAVQTSPKLPPEEREAFHASVTAIMKLESAASQLEQDATGRIGRDAFTLQAKADHIRRAGADLWSEIDAIAAKQAGAR